MTPNPTPEVERVARAICENGAVPADWANRSEHQRNCFRKDAAAAIAAYTAQEIKDVDAHIAALRSTAPQASEDADTDADYLRFIAEDIASHPNDRERLNRIANTLSAPLDEMEQVISAWAFAHNIDGAARNDLFARLRHAALQQEPDTTVDGLSGEGIGCDPC